MSDTVLSAEEFKYAFRGHPAGVAVVTADIGDGPVAMTVSSLFSVGLEPPTLVFSASALSSASPTILNAETVVVHLISAEEVEIAKLGATSGVDRFGPDVVWDRLPTGEPYYPEVGSWIRGRVSQVVPAGGSRLVVVEALESKAFDLDAPTHPTPLVYHNRSWHRIDDNSLLDD